MALSSDYIKTDEPEKGLLERYGYTLDEFKSWLNGNAIKPKYLIEKQASQPIEPTVDKEQEDLDDFFS